MEPTEMDAQWGPFDWVPKGGSRKHREHLERMAMLRHVRGPGAGFGGPPFGLHFGGRRGRKRRGDVRAALLLLLIEEPRNGYQLMQIIEERSGGRWRPSPGSVYPALAQLEDEGYVRSVERDGSRLFEITGSGRTHLEQRHSDRAPWELDDDDDPRAEALGDLRSLIGQLHVATMQVGQAASEPQLQRAAEVLTEARRALYRILAEDLPEAEGDGADGDV